MRYTTSLSTTIGALIDMLHACGMIWGVFTVWQNIIHQCFCCFFCCLVNLWFRNQANSVSLVCPFSSPIADSISLHIPHKCISHLVATLLWTLKLGTLPLSIACYLFPQQTGGHSGDVLTGIRSCVVTRLKGSFQGCVTSVLHPVESGHRATHLATMCVLVRLDPLALIIACLITL